MRHRIAIAIGLLSSAAITTVTLAQPQGAKPAHAERPVSGAKPAPSAQQPPQRLARQQAPRSESFLPGFRLPPELERSAAPHRSATALRRPAVAAQRPPVPAPRPAATPPHRPEPARAQPVQPVQGKTSKQALRTQPSQAEHQANVAVATSDPPLLTGPRAKALVSEARRYLGTNPTNMASRWCARFMNFVLDRVGLPGTGSDAAKSFALYGRRISGPQYGAIAVLSRKGGGHVGIVTGVDRNGNPILIAGNNGKRKVGISVYPKRRVIAYVLPDGRAPAKAKNIRYAGAKATRVASLRKTR